MNLVRYIVVFVALGVLAGAAVGWWRLRAVSTPALECDPSQVGLDDAGIARCGAAGPLPPAQAMALGEHLDLNEASAETLALVPGIGPSLAKAIIERRSAIGRFTAWSELDAVPGIGPAKLEALGQRFRLGGFDAGL